MLSHLILISQLELGVLATFLANYYGRSYFRILFNSNFKIFVLTSFHKDFLNNLGFDNKRVEIVPNYLKIKKNLNLVITFKMFFIMCWLIWTSARMMLSQWLNNNVVQIGKNRYIVTFTIGGKRYSAIIKHSVGPSPVLQVVDTKDNDITATVEPFILFNMESVTPGDLGYDALSVMNHDGTDSDYNKNDIIRL